MPDVSDRAALGKNPIPGESPVGVSARYDPEFESLTAEIGKLEAVDGPAVNWGRVVSLAVAILSGKSKDLLAAAYLSAGLFHTEGYTGLAAGAGVCRDLMVTFWDGLFPPLKRMRARASALQWMSERVSADVDKRGDAGESDREPLKAAVACLQEIDNLAREKVGDDSADVSGLLRALRNKLSTIPEPVSEPEPSAVQPSAAPPPPPPPEKLEIETPQDAEEYLDLATEDLIKAARVLRQADPTDALAYRLLRTALWWKWDEVPEHRDGQTGVAGGDPGLRNGLEELLQNREHEQVLEQSEELLIKNFFWLDLNLISCRAMEGLGGKYDMARKAVGNAVAAFVLRFPELLSLRFAGGAPFAGEDTALWITNELLGRGQVEGSPANPRLGEVVGEARKLITRKKFAPAAELFRKELDTVPHRRERFVWRLNLARLCMDAGKQDLALPQLEALDEELRRFSIDEWEPELSVDVVRMLWQCYSDRSDPVSQERSRSLFSRLCSLDLAEAVAAEAGRK